MKIKKIVFILISILLLTGCSFKNDNNSIFMYLIDDNVEYIKLEKDTVFKNTKDRNEEKEVFELLRSIKIVDNNEKEIINPNSSNAYRLKIYDKTDELKYSISFINDKVFYKGKWYKVDNSTIDELEQMYIKLNDKEKINTLEKKKKNRILARKTLTFDKSLYGEWENVNGVKVDFQNDVLNIGEHSFKYDIERSESNTLFISAYGTKGLFIENKKLFDMEIEFDSIKCRIKVKKSMVSGDIYYDNFVYIDKEKYQLGTFDSLFFYPK